MARVVEVRRLRPQGRKLAERPIFVGRVRTQPAVDEALSDEHRVLEVSFERGARTKLHTHTTDQVLLITAGRGVVGTRGERHEVGPGDVVFIPSGEPHFHGAAEGADMTHYSVLGVSETAILE